MRQLGLVDDLHRPAVIVQPDRLVGPAVDLHGRILESRRPKDQPGHRSLAPSFDQRNSQGIWYGLPARPLRRRSEGSRVGKERGSPCRARWSPYHENKKKKATD